MKFENIEEDDFPVAASCKDATVVLEKNIRDKMKASKIRFISKRNSHFPYNKIMYEECFGIKFEGKTLIGIRAKNSPDFSFSVNDEKAMDEFLKKIK